MLIYSENFVITSFYTVKFVIILQMTLRLFLQKTLTYKRSIIHRIVPDFIIQMGDITVGDGTGGMSSVQILQ